MRETELLLAEIGNRIKELRLKKGYTQEELAKKMGYTSRSTINKIEKGIVDISQSKIIDFANALNTTPLYLLGWIETQNTNTNLITIQKDTGEQLKYYLSAETTEEIIELIDKSLKVEEE